MEIDLTNKNILVTGASRGIGRAIAELLLQSGATVGIHYNINKKLATEVVELGKGTLMQSDLSKPMEAALLVDNFIEKTGKLDVIILNAGIAIKSGPDKGDLDWVHDWETTLTTNLTSCAVMCKKSIEHFEKNQGGIIITISSRAAFRGDTPEYMAYASSKAGLVALTKSIARGYGKKGIIAFSIAPGFTKTDMAQDFIDHYGEEYAMSDIALNQLTDPKDIAPTVAFLASGLANHATGCTIDINAGSYVR